MIPPNHHTHMTSSSPPTLAKHAHMTSSPPSQELPLSVPLPPLQRDRQRGSHCRVGVWESTGLRQHKLQDTHMPAAIPGICSPPPPRPSPPLPTETQQSTPTAPPPTHIRNTARMSSSLPTQLLPLCQWPCRACNPCHRGGRWGCGVSHTLLHPTPAAKHMGPAA
jgi:hypothetical protein